MPKKNHLAFDCILVHPGGRLNTFFCWIFGAKAMIVQNFRYQKCFPLVCSNAFICLSSPYPGIMPVFVPLPLPPSKPVIIHTGALPSTICKLVKFPVVHNVTSSPCNFGQYLCLITSQLLKYFCSLVMLNMFMLATYFFLFLTGEVT